MAEMVSSSLSSAAQDPTAPDSNRADDKHSSVLEYLATRESHEPDVWLRDDIHVAWLCVLYAGREYRDPWGFAFWRYFGKTHAKALIAWGERRELMQREIAACQPAEFPLYVSARRMLKKPVQSVRQIERRERAS